MNDLAIVGLEWLGALALFLGFILFLRYLEHRERITMIEHGLVEELEGERPRSRRGAALLRGGLITAMVGLAVTVGLYTLGYLLPPPFSAVPGRFGPWLLPGLIPLAVGVALVASYYLSPPHGVARRGAGRQSTEGDTAEGKARHPGLRILDTHRDDAANG